MPERSKGARCKRAGYAYAGSNPAPPTSFERIGARAAARTRTGDPVLTMHVLYRLSYGGLVTHSRRGPRRDPRPHLRAVQAAAEAEE
jgi:hypothetical protein